MIRFRLSLVFVILCLSWGDIGTANRKGSNDEWVHPGDPEARITKMKDGRTRLAHKLEQAVDMESGVLTAVTVQSMEDGDTASLPKTLDEAAKQLGEVELAAEEVVADKGYHSNGAMKDLSKRGLRSYVSEPRRGPQKLEEGQSGTGIDVRQPSQDQGEARSLSAAQERRNARTELCAPAGDRAMRRVHLRGQVNIRKQMLIHAGARNPGLVMRTLFRAGTHAPCRGSQPCRRLWRNQPRTQSFCFTNSWARSWRLLRAIGPGQTLGRCANDYPTTTDHHRPPLSTPLRNRLRPTTQHRFCHGLLEHLFPRTLTISSGENMRTSSVLGISMLLVALPLVAQGEAETCRTRLAPFFRGAGGFVVKPVNGRSVEIVIEGANETRAETRYARSDGLVVELLKPSLCVRDDLAFVTPVECRVSFRGVEGGGWYWVNGDRNAGCSASTV